jgi:hypothetical protein
MSRNNRILSTTFVRGAGIAAGVGGAHCLLGRERPGNTPESRPQRPSLLTKDIRHHRRMFTLRCSGETLTKKRDRTKMWWHNSSPRI